MTSLQRATKNDQTRPGLDRVPGPAVWAARINAYWCAAIETIITTGRELVAWADVGPALLATVERRRANRDVVASDHQVARLVRSC